MRLFDVGIIQPTTVSVPFLGYTPQSWLLKECRMATFFANLEVPSRLRAFARAREISLVFLALVAGAAAGVVVATMAGIVELLHIGFFGLIPGERLSAQNALEPLRALLVPALGGLALGFSGLWVAWLGRPRQEVDPIEANALHGGRMSLIGSLIVAAQTVWSSGVGASVGLEAGYTQLASAVSSRVGYAFRLRRHDLRILVGCGAAGGIAGAFGAPLSGAFYAFELIIGSYSVAGLASVAVAAVLGLLVTKALSSTPLGIFASSVLGMSDRDLVLAGVLGMISALVGIALMRSVSLCETLLRHYAVWRPLRPMLGGIVVGLCALVSPQVMSSGHGALYLTGVLDRPLQTIAVVFALKAVASIASLGCGFRGGLFFASLLLGALGGHLFAAGLMTAWPELALDPRAYGVIAMGALSASVIGGPLTMTFIALETTGDLRLTAAVLVAVVVSVTVTREAFGYSFATWRFHLRGETIRSAADIGWMRDLTVARMMRHDVKTTTADISIAQFREAFPLGATGRVVAVDGDGRYAGIVSVPDAHASELSDTTPIRELLRYRNDVLLPDMTIRTAVALFDETEAEALAVVDSAATRRVIGLLTEAHALRRYAEESEKRRRELLGEK